MASALPSTIADDDPDLEGVLYFLLHSLNNAVTPEQQTTEQQRRGLVAEFRECWFTANIDIELLEQR